MLLLINGVKKDLGILIDTFLIVLIFYSYKLLNVILF